MTESLYKPLIACLILFALNSCARKDVPAVSTGDKMPGPRCIVYKTKTDYSRLVPVILTPDRKQIASYPDIRDVYFDGALAYPSALQDGYLLDNRGISPGVAFLRLTYEEYSKLPATPRPAELLRMIIDRDPLLEMYDCGLRSAFSDPVAEMNRMIGNGGLQDQKRLK